MEQLRLKQLRVGLLRLVRQGRVPKGGAVEGGAPGLVHEGGVTKGGAAEGGGCGAACVTVGGG